VDNRVKFWGAATVGTKGQIVIPSEAREKFAIKMGDKVVFFSLPGEHGKDSLTVIKAEVFEELMEKVNSDIMYLLEQTKKAQNG
jgi:AbrB family looped-hinge helix DNA binding protein